MVVCALGIVFRLSTDDRLIMALLVSARLVRATLCDFKFLALYEQQCHLFPFSFSFLCVIDSDRL